MVDWASMRECMNDAGCSESTIRRAEHFYQSGSAEDLIHCLRSCRCDALQEIHEKQRQLDRLDKLIRETKNREALIKSECADWRADFSADEA